LFALESATVSEVDISDPRREFRRVRVLAAALLFFCLIQPGHSTPRPYHLEFDANLGAVFPRFRRFGNIKIHVYPAGVRADSALLNAFSRNGAPNLTVLKPMVRMHTDVAFTEMTAMIAAGTDEFEDVPRIVGPTVGRVGSLAATRYRLQYNKTEWIDVWTNRDVPANAQFRVIMDAAIRGLSERSADVARKIPGTPVYIELNFRGYSRVALLKLRRLTWNNVGETAALNLGNYYFKVPILDAIWR
jgi:hypothetical protein